MLSRHSDKVQIVDISTSPQMKHEPDITCPTRSAGCPTRTARTAPDGRREPSEGRRSTTGTTTRSSGRRAGARGYLHKSLNSGGLVNAISRCTAATPLPVADDAEPAQTWPGQALGLSEREAEMLTFIMRGLSNEEIARRAYLSIHTVKT